MPHFLCFSSIRYPPLKDHVRIVGPASVLRVIFATCGARYQIYRDSSTSRMVLRLASVPVSRPLAQSGHRVNCLPTWSVCVSHDEVQPAEHGSNARTRMHTPCHCFLHTAVRSVPVPACRPLVVTKLTEGPSSSEVVKRMGAPPRRLAPRETTCSVGRCSALLAVSRPVQRLRARGLNSPVIRQHEHYCMLSLPGRDIQQFPCVCTGAGTSQEERAGNKSR